MLDFSSFFLHFEKEVSNRKVGALYGAFCKENSKYKYFNKSGFLF